MHTNEQGGKLQFEMGTIFIEHERALRHQSEHKT